MRKSLNVEKMTNNATVMINNLVNKLNYGRNSEYQWYYNFKCYSNILPDEKLIKLRIDLNITGSDEYSIESLHNLSSHIIDFLNKNNIDVSLVKESPHLCVDIDSYYDTTEVSLYISLSLYINKWSEFDSILEQKAIEDSELREKEKEKKKQKRKEKAEQKKKKEQDERLLLETLIKKYGIPNI